MPSECRVSLKTRSTLIMPKKPDPLHSLTACHVITQTSDTLRVCFSLFLSLCVLCACVLACLCVCPAACPHCNYGKASQKKCSRDHGNLFPGSRKTCSRDHGNLFPGSRRPVVGIPEICCRDHGKRKCEYTYVHAAHRQALHLYEVREIRGQNRHNIDDVERLV